MYILILIDMSWYRKKSSKRSSKSLDLTSKQEKSIEELSAVPDIKNIYGIFNPNTSEYHFIFTCKKSFEDFLSIDDSESGPFNIKINDLEDYGYSKKSVLLTKKITNSLPKDNYKWIESSDNKLLIWGPDQIYFIDNFFDPNKNEREINLFNFNNLNKKPVLTWCCLEEEPKNLIEKSIKIQ